MYHAMIWYEKHLEYVAGILTRFLGIFHTQKKESVSTPRIVIFSGYIFIDGVFTMLYFFCSFYCIKYVMPF